MRKHVARTRWPLEPTIRPLPINQVAPELADLPVVSPLTAMAKAQVSDNPPDVSPPARKRRRVEPGTYGQRGFGDAEQWNFGSHGLSNNRVWSGGPKSWF